MTSRQVRRFEPQPLGQVLRLPAEVLPQQGGRSLMLLPGRERPAVQVLGYLEQQRAVGLGTDPAEAAAPAAIRRSAASSKRLRTCSGMLNQSRGWVVNLLSVAFQKSNVQQEQRGMVSAQIRHRKLRCCGAVARFLSACTRPTSSRGAMPI